MRLLLIEDDPMIGDSIAESLRSERYAVDWVRDGHSALLALEDDVYDLVLLDLGLPKRGGLEVLQRYRNEGGGARVLIITARDSTAERVEGLDSGADDYLVKPFELDELFARVRALLRRQSGRAQPDIVHRGVRLKMATHEAFLGNDPLPLSVREFALLAALLDPPGQVMSKSKLEQKLYGWNEEVESNTVDVYVHRLRKKLGADFIRNVRGVGYLVDA
ncbi:response regulator [Massilia terrae]|uniref:Response regulator n=1 Tax=Massilia terrae TaxID=1811224 RepID=A0ABT2CZP2_9BURK|nr:response regulator [Massilia terrae]MCS0659344.1 response regulator [Massilia terrae]